MKDERDDSYGHVLKYTGIFGGVQGLNILISIIRNKVTALLLGPSGMGLIALFQTTVNFISQATNLGISFSAVRNVSELFDTADEARIAHFIRVVRAWSLLTGLLGMLICILIGSMLSNLTFSWGDHSLHFVLLSPLVAMLAVTGGETAILKGARQLKSLAVIQVYSVLIGLFIIIPIYYFFGESGIVPVLVLLGLTTMLLTIHCSYRFYPLQLAGNRSVFGEGMDMVRLGIAFTLAGILGSGADFVIRSYLNNVAGLDTVGLYNAGYMMTMTYAGMVFSAMETDYFPRLSSVNHQPDKFNELINRQIEVSLLLISPMVVIAISALPVAIPILFTSQFLPVVDMMRLMSLALIFRAVNLPIEYLSLAKGSSKFYLFLECAYDIFMTILVVVGYHLYGLIGTGYALLASALLNSLMVISFMKLKFGVQIRHGVYAIFFAQFPVGVFACIVAMTTCGWLYWISEFLLFALSLCVSFYVLKQKSKLWNKLVSRITSRFRHGS